MNLKTLIIAALPLLFFHSCKSQNTQATETPFGEISIEAVKKIIEEKGDYVLVDVRTPQEISQGKIEGALEIDFYSDNFKNEISKLDKNASYIMYCRSGSRSGQAMNLMETMGFKSVKNMVGGYSSWK